LQQSAGRAGEIRRGSAMSDRSRANIWNKARVGPAPALERQSQPATRTQQARRSHVVGSRFTRNRGPRQDSTTHGGIRIEAETVRRLRCTFLTQYCGQPLQSVYSGSLATGGSQSNSSSRSGRCRPKRCQSPTPIAKNCATADPMSLAQYD
jgi:hypothetical protein